MPNLTTKKIYYLGPEGTNTHKALANFVVERGIEFEQLESLRTIKSVLNAVEKNEDSLGVVPVENSIEGVVRETIDNLIRIKDSGVQILAEHVLPINHCLLSKSTDISSIKTVISHPQALAQCGKFLDERLPNATVMEGASTSAAAKEVSSSDDSYAAIAGCQSAEIFGLNILASGINDEKDNVTRFILIGRHKTVSTGNDKTSITFATKNRAGALFKVLEIFNSKKINLLYIDSRPSKKYLGEYNFFIDFDGHAGDEEIKVVLEDIKSNVNFFRLNGSYQKYKKETT